jgi:hypothetical protein
MVLAGCGAPGPPPEAAAPPLAEEGAEAPVSPERRLFEQVRAGAVQLGGVSEALAGLLRRTHGSAAVARGQAREALDEAAAYLDSAGATIADHAVEPPPFEEFVKDLPLRGQGRLRAIEAANDARVDLQSAATILSEAGPEGATLSEEARSLVADLEEAIGALGGSVEQSAAP